MENVPASPGRFCLSYLIQSLPEVVVYDVRQSSHEQEERIGKVNPQVSAHADNNRYHFSGRKTVFFFQSVSSRSPLMVVFNRKEGICLLGTVGGGL